MAEKEEKKVTVKVIKDNHTHKGEKVEKGDAIEVYKSQIKWLTDNKIIEG